jgi:hypothetical protein
MHEHRDAKQHLKSRRNQRVSAPTPPVRLWRPVLCVGIASISRNLLVKAPQTGPKRGASRKHVRKDGSDLPCGRGGAAYRTRTCDPRITNAMLYQLS